MGTFLHATKVTKQGGRYSAVLDPDWFIWGPFGGYLAALALRAMGLHSNHRRPATVSCQYLNVGRIGPIDIEVVNRKSGRRAECVRVSLLQRGKILLDAQSWMVADDLPGLTHDHARMPAIKPASELRSWDGFGDPDAHSPVWKHFERRPEQYLKGPGYAPGTPEWSCWVRLLETLPSDDLVLQAACAVLWMDMAPWSAALIAHPWPTTHIAPTLDLTVQFQNHLYAPETIASDWRLFATSSPVAGGGLLGGNSTLWSESGNLLAVSTAQALFVPNPRFEPVAKNVENSGRPNVDLVSGHSS